MWFQWKLNLECWVKLNIGLLGSSRLESWMFHIQPIWRVRWVCCHVIGWLAVWWAALKHMFSVLRKVWCENSPPFMCLVAPTFGSARHSGRCLLDLIVLLLLLVYNLLVIWLVNIKDGNNVVFFRISSASFGFWLGSAIEEWKRWFGFIAARSIQWVCIGSKQPVRRQRTNTIR